MKKKLLVKLILVALLIALLVVLSSFKDNVAVCEFFATTFARAWIFVFGNILSTGHEPECCIKTVSQDGGKVTYWGLGYKVVRYVGVSPDEPYESNIGVKMGSWFMKYEKPTNEILDVKSFRENKTFKVSDKADVDFITNLLKNSKYSRNNRYYDSNFIFFWWYKS